MPECSVLHRETVGGVVLATLRRGRGNALDPPTLLALRRLFENPPGPVAPPIVLTGEGRSFCTGLDLEYGLGQDRAGMRRLMIRFHEALVACFGYRGPVIAALNGHALAGGALLALACDGRGLVRGGARFGIHGARLGIAYPDVAVEVLRHKLPRRLVERVLYEGRQWADHEALAHGLVDDLVDGDALLPWALDRARERARGEPGAYALAKRRLRAEALVRLEGQQDRGLEAWLDRWFDPATRRRVQTARGAPKTSKKGNEP